jgi:capsular exopolysaccharide synthesis family protein
MSRVDEARRRAGGRELDVPARLDTGILDVSREESVLENYPRERRTAVDRIAPVQQAQTPRAIAAPRTASAGHLGSLDPELDGKLVGSPDTPPIVMDQYRRLAASLHQLQADAGLKTLMVTSAMPREGKTLTVTNLALTLSESYRKRVLLIDADLRRPSIHEVFRLPKTIGLSEALRSGSRPHLLEPSPLLSVLPAGDLEGDPLSALTSERLQTLVDQSAAAFDWVLFDTPPTGLMPDGNVLARLTRAVVFVIGAGTSPYKTIERAISDLGRDYIVGTVLNRIDDGQLPTAGEYTDYYGPSKVQE